MGKHGRDIGLKPTVNDVARVAGVSLATVDRVLNGRPGVRNVTIERVYDAIQELGYVRDTAAANLARGRVYNFQFLLPQSNNEFVTSLEHQIMGISKVLALERTKISYEKIPAFNPQALASILSRMDPENVDGVAIFGPETAAVKEAIDQIKKRGMSVIALVSDLPSSERDYFVGIDNLAAGRTAAQLMGHFLPNGQGKVLVITGSMLARDHLERRQGFDQVINESFGGVDVLSSLEGRDDPDLLEKLLPGVFAKHPDITGIYSSAAGNAGLINFLRKTSLDDKVMVVAHELTALSREALEHGSFNAIISQDTGHLVRSTIRVLRANVDNLPINLSQERIRIDVYLRENMPPLDEKI